jgi:hypothetical protein
MDIQTYTFSEHLQLINGNFIETQTSAIPGHTDSPVPKAESDI